MTASGGTAPQRPTAVDLFCGCGGLTLGLSQAGFSVIGAADIDLLSIEAYRANHPEVKIWHKDIRALRVSTVKRKLGLRKGDLDLLAGCPPCQGFSTIRTLNDSRLVEDSRNDLIFDFQRFVEGLSPKAVMIENVPHFADSAQLRRFRERLGDLGYYVTCEVLDAADYGVPQRRRRLVLLAGRLGPISFARRARKRRSVRDTIAWLPAPGKTDDRLHDFPERRTSRIMGLIRRVPKDGGSRTDLGEADQLPCHLRCNGFKDVYGRMAWDDVAPTITCGCVNPSKGRFLHPEQDRAITLREAALLQSFPKRYHFPLKRGKFPVAGLIGNALPPEFVRRHARSIVASLEANQSGATAGRSRP